MYNIIVVDDEKIIREGLKSFFEDGTSGFSVIKTFADGKEAYEFLEKNANDIDVVLTDIKMSIVSGLKLIRLIDEAHIDVEKVLLTGYKEFEYAQTALKYGVHSYLLKPVKFNELDSVFLELKQKLDEKVKKTSAEEADELMQLLINQFLIEVDSGIFSSEEIANKRLNQLKINQDLVSKPCVTINIKRSFEDIYSKNKWNYSDERLDIAIFNAIRDDEVLYYTLSSNKNLLKIIAIPMGECADDKFFDNVKKIITSGLQNLKQIFDIDLQIMKIDEFNRISDLYKISNGDIKNVQIESLKQILVMDAVSGNNNMVQENINTLISKIKTLNNDDMIKAIENLNYVLKELFGDNFIQNNADNCSIEATEVANGIAKHSNADISNSVIARAVKYVNENYNKNIYISDVADYVYLSPMYFGRLFKIYVGENFTDYLINLRITKSIELLEKGNFKINEVSRLVGYDNVKYFTRLFKRRTGKTPSEFKKERI